MGGRGEGEGEVWGKDEEGQTHKYFFPLRQLVLRGITIILINIFCFMKYANIVSELVCQGVLKS